MSRIVKQILYGALYFVFIGFVIWGFGASFSKEGATCFDKIQNQDEVDIDCGGSICPKCKGEVQASLRVVEDVKIFHLNFEQVALLGKVANPNAGYSADQFFYRFVLYGKDGKILERIEGRDSVYASEEKFLFAGRVISAYDAISYVTLEIGDVAWEASFAKPAPKLSLQHEIMTKIEGDTIRVNGIIQNQSPFAASSVEVTAIVSNSFGDDIFASQTIIENIEGFGEASFVVSFPQSSFLKEKIDVSKTEVVISKGF